MSSWEEEGPREPRIDDRIVEILSESSGRIAFNGLRRLLGVHPDSLTRALRRLEREGAIARTRHGYAMAAPVAGGRGEAVAPVELRRIAAVELPLGADREELFGRISGRWFAGLRWTGVFDHPGDPWLVWSVEGTQTHVMLSIQGRGLRVLTDSPNSKDDAAVDGAAYQLLAHALGHLRTTGPLRRTTTYLAAQLPPAIGPN